MNFFAYGCSERHGNDRFAPGDAYDRLLPGNPEVTFFKGYSLENMQRRKEAARYYSNYLRRVNQGRQARYAYSRLRSWGYIR